MLKRAIIIVVIAWALTVHKSQGLTLDSIKIDLGGSGKAFATGQAYVALSRCKTLGGISLADPLSMNDVKTDQRVVDFYNKINAEIEEDKVLKNFIESKEYESPKANKRKKHSI